MSSFNDPTFLSVPPPPPPPRRRVRPWMIATSSILLVCCVAFLIFAYIGSKDTPTQQASHPTPTATKEPTAMPSPSPTPEPKPSPTPATSQQAYNEWLTAEVASLTDSGIIVTDSIYADPPADDIIWIQVAGLNKTAANTFCKQVASDYVARFHQQVTVHFYQAPGTDTELARCAAG